MKTQAKLLNDTEKNHVLVDITLSTTILLNAKRATEELFVLNV